MEGLTFQGKAEEEEDTKQMPALMKNKSLSIGLVKAVKVNEDVDDDGESNSSFLQSQRDEDTRKKETSLFIKQKTIVNRAKEDEAHSPGNVKPRESNGSSVNLGNPFKQVTAFH